MPRPTTKTREEVTDIRSLARVHTAMCVRSLAGIAAQSKAPAAARVSAITVLLDRGWGKPDQAHVGADGGDIKITIRQIIDIIDKRTIEHPELEVIDGEVVTP